MFSRFLAALAILLVVAGTAIAPAQAQSSFGRVAALAPQNSREWSEQTVRHLNRALRRSDSGLNSVGGNRRYSATLVVIIARDGSVTDVEVVESSGNSAMDAILVRRFREIEGIPAFTPDMTEPFIVLPLPIGTKRG